jgi:esterase
MHRHVFEHDGLRLSYLDAGGTGRPLLALHAHWMQGGTFEPLARALAPTWRVIAPDQRGHGESDHAEKYERREYVGDALALLDRLEIGRAVVLGHSLGAVNAYQLAAWHATRVTALIVEDMGAVVTDDPDVALPWAGVFPTLEALEARIGAEHLRDVRASFREVPGGWRLAFDPNDMAASERALNGDHWADWLGSACPALLLRGSRSPKTNPAEFEAMAARRPGTRLVTLEAGHVIHVENPAGFESSVRNFLNELGD